MVTKVRIIYPVNIWIKQFCIKKDSESKRDGTYLLIENRGKGFESLIVNYGTHLELCDDLKQRLYFGKTEMIFPAYSFGDDDLW